MKKTTHIGTCLMISLEGPRLSKKEKTFMVSNHISGVVLFKKNLESFKQIHKLCSEIKSLSHPSPLIAIDMEGGSVNRFSHLKESPPWPAPEVLKQLPPKDILFIAQAMGQTLKLLGIDINFAPVVDLPLLKSPLLKTRVFGTSKKEILRSARPFIKGLVKGGMIPCLKHFPGHGGVKEDSHKTLPKDPRGLKNLKDQLKIFESLFKTQNCGIMTAHIEFPKIEKTPASFSKVLLKKLLKQQMKFKGFIVSDDIDMSALKSFSKGESFYNSLKGGCDLVITCQNQSTPQNILQFFQKNPSKKQELKTELKQASQKILSLREKSSLPQPNFKLVEKQLAQVLSKKLWLI